MTVDASASPTPVDGDAVLVDFAVIGVPATMLLGVPFIAFTSKKLLPSRISLEEEVEGGREYTIEMMVPPRSPIAGKSIEQADLRRLPGIYLAEIDRDGIAMPAPGPETILEEGDRVIFAGVVGSVVDLLKGRGLVPATDQVHKIDADRRDRTVVEAVISHGSPLVRTTVRQSQFRTRYNAAIIAVHRGGQRIKDAHRRHPAAAGRHAPAPDASGLRLGATATRRTSTWSADVEGADRGAPRAGMDRPRHHGNARRPA